MEFSLRHGGSVQLRELTAQARVFSRFKLSRTSIFLSRVPRQCWHAGSQKLPPAHFHWGASLTVSQHISAHQSQSLFYNGLEIIIRDVFSEPTQLKVAT